MSTGNSQTVQVTFDAPGASRRVTFSRRSIAFDNAAPGTVTFNLVNQPSPALQARFPSNPIQWVRKIDENGTDVDTNLQPIDQPPGAQVSRDNDMTTTITIKKDRQGATKKFRFYVIVQTTDGQFFGTDPTIVTMPPDT